MYIVIIVYNVYIYVSVLLLPCTPLKGEFTCFDIVISFSKVTNGSFGPPSRSVEDKNITMSKHVNSPFNENNNNNDYVGK